METMGIRLSVVKQSFFGPPGQYGRLVTRANEARFIVLFSTVSLVASNRCLFREINLNMYAYVCMQRDFSEPIRLRWFVKQPMNFLPFVSQTKVTEFRDA